MKYISFSAVLLVLAVAAILPTNSQVISSALEPQVVPQGHGCFWSGTSPFCFGKCGKFYHTVATDRRGNGKKCLLPKRQKQLEKASILVSILEAVYSMEKKIAQVVVVGSFMSDVVTYVDRLPNAGETITGNQLVLCCGGKGANQCVSAARLGARTSMIGKLGKDSFGDEHLQTMTAEGVDTTHITVTDEALTGVGQLTVLPNGQNRVITVSGANAYLTVNDIAYARTTISTAKVLLCEIQVEKDTAIAALQTANDLGVLTILNAAPACPNLDPAFLMLSDIFCVNETEAEVTTGIQVRSLDEAAAAAKCLLEKGCKNHVLITLGAQGALLLSRGDAEKPVHIKAPAVSAIDTTGAGDCFLGALAFFLATRPELVLHKAIEYACIVASLSVQRNGTQPSFPHWNELPNELFRSD